MIRCFNFVCTVCTNNLSATSLAYPCSLHQSRKLDLNQCAVAKLPVASLIAFTLFKKGIRTFGTHVFHLSQAASTRSPFLVMIFSEPAFTCSANSERLACASENGTTSLAETPMNNHQSTKCAKLFTITCQWLGVKGSFITKLMW